MAEMMPARARPVPVLGRRAVLLAIATGALMSAAHPPAQFPWVLFAAMPALVWLTGDAGQVRGADFVGWGGGFGHFITVLRWMGYPFLVDAEQFAWLMPLPVLIFPALLAIFWAGAFAFARRFWPGQMLAGAVVLAASISGAEILRSFLFTGYPWALPGYVWLDLPPMQAASWIGPFGMTLLTLLLTALPLLALWQRQWAVLALSLAAGAAIWFAGASRLEPTSYADDAPVIRIVQPNAPQHLKFEPGYREEFYRRLLEGTAAPADPELGPPDLVIWPETAIHFLLDENPEEIARIAELAGGATVILGAMRREQGEPRDRWYNSLLVIRPDGTLGQIGRAHV